MKRSKKKKKTLVRRCKGIKKKSKNGDAVAETENEKKKKSLERRCNDLTKSLA